MALSEENGTTNDASCTRATEYQHSQTARIQGLASRPTSPALSSDNAMRYA